MAPVPRGEAQTFFVAVVSNTVAHDGQGGVRKSTRDPVFADKAGIPQKVAQQFVAADKAKAKATYIKKPRLNYDVSSRSRSASTAASAEGRMEERETPPVRGIEATHSRRP